MHRMTYSAATDFCTSVKQRNIGILIGEECGSPVRYPGNLQKGTLPHSKIGFVYPQIYLWYNPEVPSKNGFLQPDIRYDVFGKTLKIEDYKKIIRLSNTLEKHNPELD